MGVLVIMATVDPAILASLLDDAMNRPGFSGGSNS
jgi:hypothetical protein